jgi:hypothetical protein
MPFHSSNSGQTIAMQQTTSKRLLPAQPPARQGIARNRGATGAQSCIKAAAL